MKTVSFTEHFVVWITCMIKDYEDLIVANVIKKGYTVGALQEGGKLTLGEPDRAAVVISFSAYSHTDSKKTKDVYADVLSILTEHNMFYYSVIVSVYTSESLWISTNIAPRKKVEELPPIPSPDKKMN